MSASQGKVYFVTGAAVGIGAAVCRAAVSRGFRVAIADIDLAAAERLAQELGEAALPIRLDVRDQGAWDAALDLATQHFGVVDVLVNNAGVVHPGLMGEVPIQKHRDTFEVNVFGPMFGTLAALPRFRAQGHGHIATICSLSAFAVYPVIVTYGASKAALRNLHLGFAYEERNGVVDFTIVHPNATQTPMLDYEARMGVDASFAHDPIQPETVAEILLDAIRDKKLEVSAPLDHLDRAVEGGRNPEAMIQFIETTSKVGAARLAERFSKEERFPSSS